jgi:hypothetical protein
LAATVLWLVSVTLCSTGVFAGVSHDHPAAGGHSAHAHGAAHDHGAHPEDPGCGCESFKAFPAQTAALAKAPVPSVSVFYYAILLDEFIHDYAAITITAQGCGPPERLSCAELVLQRCCLSHAPPAVA